MMGFIKYKQKGPVAILTIDRREALNALNSQVLCDLDEAITKVEQDESVRVVILTGAGRSFVAGADIGEMKGFSAIDGKTLRRPRRLHLPAAGEPVQAGDRRGQRLRPGRRLRAGHGL